MDKKKVLVTGASGFIGMHLMKRLLSMGYDVVGIDSINDYYDVNLKYDRLRHLNIDVTSIEYNKKVSVNGHPGSSFFKLELSDKEALISLFESENIQIVCNLAAQAGVRYSLENPDAYVTSNLVGFMNILECSRHFNVENLVYASTSSVYGLNRNMPFSESDSAEHPITLYAATKKSNEMMAHSYSHLFGIPTTGLRFFTVYGPWGRPDMAIFLFTKSIIEGKPIKVFNFGKMIRDFTYVDDIISGVVKCLQNPAKPDPDWDNRSTPDPSRSSAPYRIYNIGNSNAVTIETYIDLIEKNLGIQAIKDYLPIQPGDVSATHANVQSISSDLGYSPSTPVAVGVQKFVEWYRAYYKV